MKHLLLVLGGWTMGCLAFVEKGWGWNYWAAIIGIFALGGWASRMEKRCRRLSE